MGKSNIFPENVGAEGYTLNIYEVNPDTGMFTSGDAIDAGWDIGSDGSWGPVDVKKNTTYAFVLEHDTESDATHIFYREPFMADNFFVRLNTARPGEGLSSQLARSENHSNVMVARDKEMWGDVPGGNDELLVNGVSALTEEAGAQIRRLSTLFLCDNNLNQQNDLEGTIAAVTQESFLAGTDFYIAASADADETVAIQLTSRGSTVSQTINIPNWPSDEVRMITVHFRDSVR